VFEEREGEKRGKYGGLLNMKKVKVVPSCLDD